jgi:hypothetical protein
MVGTAFILGSIVFGDGHALQERNSTNKRKPFLFFVTFLGIVLAFLFASLFSMVMVFFFP